MDENKEKPVPNIFGPMLFMSGIIMGLFLGMSFGYMIGIDKGIESIQNIHQHEEGGENTTIVVKINEADLMTCQDYRNGYEDLRHEVLDLYHELTACQADHGHTH